MYQCTRRPHGAVPSTPCHGVCQCRGPGCATLPPTRHGATTTVCTRRCCISKEVRRGAGIWMIGRPLRSRHALPLRGMCTCARIHARVCSLTGRVVLLVVVQHFTLCGCLPSYLAINYEHSDRTTTSMTWPSQVTPCSTTRSVGRFRVCRQPLPAPRRSDYPAQSRASPRPSTERVPLRGTNPVHTFSSSSHLLLHSHCHLDHPLNSSLSRPSSFSCAISRSLHFVSTAIEL